MDISLQANTPLVVSDLVPMGTYRFFFTHDLRGRMSIEAECADGVFTQITNDNSGVINGLPGTKLRFVSPYATAGKLDLLE